MEKKFLYEAPEMETILLKLEQGILIDSNMYNPDGHAGNDLQETDDNTFSF